LAGDPAEHTDATGELVNPEFFASGGIERDKRTLLCRYIGDVIDYQRTERITGLIPRWVTPSNLQIIYVINIYLLKWRVMRSCGTAEVIFPVGSLAGNEIASFRAGKQNRSRYVSD
jgi:hypothetical protein